MCLALPTCILEVRPQQQALVELGGVKKEISTALVGEVKPGDYVIVHVGHAIGLVDPEEAKKTLAMFATLENGAAA